MATIRNSNVVVKHWLRTPLSGGAARPRRLISLKVQVGQVAPCCICVTSC